MCSVKSAVFKVINPGEIRHRSVDERTVRVQFQGSMGGTAIGDQDSRDQEVINIEVEVVGQNARHRNVQNAVASHAVIVDGGNRGKVRFKFESGEIAVTGA